MSKVVVDQDHFVFILKGLQRAAFLQDSSPKQGELIVRYVILLFNSAFFGNPFPSFFRLS